MVILGPAGLALRGMFEFQDGVFMVAALGSDEPQPEMRPGRSRIKIRGFGQGLGGLVEAFKVVSATPRL